ncbi:hypothetical protein TNCV_622101 [Trichonephila clavipes]|nr:hypothetical protein TNCV_622101 [Trichonephila clavipes]
MIERLCCNKRRHLRRIAGHRWSCRNRKQWSALTVGPAGTACGRIIQSQSCDTSSITCIDRVHVKISVDVENLGDAIHLIVVLIMVHRLKHTSHQGRRFAADMRPPHHCGISPGGG